MGLQAARLGWVAGVVKYVNMVGVGIILSITNKLKTTFSVLHISLFVFTPQPRLLPEATSNTTRMIFIIQLL